MKNQVLIWLVIGLVVVSCSTRFLDERPNSDIITPEEKEDFQRLLDNFNVIGYTAALPHLSGDEYFIPSREAWLSARTAIERYCYVWDEDVYGGETNIEDWNAPYRTIFYANNIINAILTKGTDLQREANLQDIYGQALFQRAKANFDLLKNFGAPFDPATHQQELGIPLRTDPSIDYIQKRATVKECYHAIFDDLELASNHLQYTIPLPQRNRATKLAAFALLSRIHLYRGEYRQAEIFSDSVLFKYDKLIDYNDLSQVSNTPFSLTNDELIMYGSTVNYNNSSQLNQRGTVFVDTNLLKLYESNDLRRSIFFTEQEEGRAIVKRGYNGSGLAPFNGLAVDEVFLIKMECLVRRGALNEGADLFNKLRLKRYKFGSYEPAGFKDLDEALQSILMERRKQLVWRGLRWDDIKRLNREGAGITLHRTLGDVKYVLEPNSKRYVFNIPQDEINRSGISQNQR